MNKMYQHWKGCTTYINYHCLICVSYLKLTQEGPECAKRNFNRKFHRPSPHYWSCWLTKKKLSCLHSSLNKMEHCSLGLSWICVHMLRCLIHASISSWNLCTHVTVSYTCQYIKLKSVSKRLFYSLCICPTLQNRCWSCILYYTLTYFFFPSKYSPFVYCSTHLLPQENCKYSTFSIEYTFNIFYYLYTF